MAWETNPITLLFILTWDLERWELGICSNGCTNMDYRPLRGNVRDLLVQGYLLSLEKIQQNANHKKFYLSHCRHLTGKRDHTGFIRPQKRKSRSRAGSIVRKPLWLGVTESFLTTQLSETGAAPLESGDDTPLCKCASGSTRPRTNVNHWPSH